MLFNWIKNKLDLTALWEDIFTVDRSFFRRMMIALVIALAGFGLISILFNFTGRYFSSVIEISIITIVFYCGFFMALFYAILLSVAVDYFYIPPLGIIFKSFVGNERFFIIVLIAILAASFASTIKSSFQKVVLAKKEAENATAMMEKFLALVVHDVRNPLASIKMGAQIILKKPQDTDKHQIILKKIIRNIDHADSMIKTLLDTASIKAGKTITLVFQYSDLNSHISKMIEDMYVTISDNLEFVLCHPLWGNWGINGISRALENLITNAIKYGSFNTPITVQLIQKDQFAILSVHNEGNEISLSDQSKLFELFHRTHDAESGTVKGWGLGLSLVAAVAEAHGGTVEVDSGKGQGTTFVLKIPIKN